MATIIPFPNNLLRKPDDDGPAVGRSLPWYLQGIEACTSGKVGRESYSGKRVVTLDFETTNLSHGDSRDPGNRIILGSSKAGDEPARRVTRSQLEAQLREASVLIAHNAKFELGWLMRLGLPWEHLLVFDTMIAERVRYGNQKISVALDATCKRYGLPSKDPLIDAMMKGGLCPSEMPRHLLQERCDRDVETTYLVFKRQLEEMTDAEINVVFTRCIVTPVLACIEREGLTLDKDRVYSEYGSVAQELARIDRTLTMLIGGRNMRSPVQRAEVLYDILKFKAPKRYGKPVLTASGLRPTDKATIKSLVAKTKKQIAFLESYKRRTILDARMSKSLRFFQAVCTYDNCKFYGNFHQTRTATHRTSSTSLQRVYPEIQKKPLGTQLQNLPREYKKLFCSPDPDYEVFEVDGAQLEFRVAAFLGQDPVAIAAIVNGEDVHRDSASVLFNVPASSVTSAQRTDAKAETFKPLYGGEFGTPAQMAYYKFFRTKYNAIYRTQMGWVSKVLKDKKITMPWGMTFYFPHARMKGDGYCPDKPSIFNYPVQNLATAEIIPVSLTFLFWRGRLNDIRMKLTNTVHDSGVGLIHKADKAKLTEIARQSFFSDTYKYLDHVYNIKFNVPLGLGIKIGPHWGEGHEEKFSEMNREAA